VNAKLSPAGLPAGDAAERTLAFLADLSEALAVSLDLRQTLEQAVTRIAGFMQAEAASMFLLDPASGLLECRICVGPVNLLGLKLARGQGVVGHAVEENAVQLVRDAQRDARVHLRVDAETGFVTRSILCAPLSTANGPIGVLEVINRKDGTPFDEADARVLRVLAAPTALAINNARLARDQLEQQRLKREFDLARKLQKALLPKRRRGGFPLLAVNVPAHEISGDFYDYFDLPDGRMGFVVGDVSGKGLDAAMLMTRAASLLRWAGKDGLTPAAWLKRANDELCETTSEGRFVCALVGVYTRATREVRFAGAGFPPVLRAHGGAIDELPSEGPPLGILPGVEFGEHVLALGSGTLYAFSDGVTDVRSGAGRLGGDGVRALVQRYAKLAPESRLRAIVHELKQLKLVDDTTLLLLEEPRQHGAEVLLQCRFPAHPGELRTLRAALRPALDHAGVEPELRDQLVLAVDEACCNVIRHAYDACGCHGDIALVLRRHEDVLEFELADEAPPVDPSKVKPRDLSECRPGGLGINIIDATMDEWIITPRADGRGNVLRMKKRVPHQQEEQ
jgi:sigma-B regulation protein RsbU (phosphoserine phosphatase)